MIRSRHHRILGSAAAVLVLLAATALTLWTSRDSAVAQSSSSSDSANTTVTYSSRYVNKVVVTKTDQAIKKIYPFPDSPVFIVDTGNALAVWVRYDKALRMLREIKMTETLKEIVFLEDHRTFIVQTNSEAQVYSIDRTYTPASSD